MQIFDEVAAGAPPPADTDWTAHAIAVTATGTTSTVEFEDGSFSNPGVGTYIDNLPEPGRSTALLAGLAMIVGLARLRRKSHAGGAPR